MWISLFEIVKLILVSKCRNSTCKAVFILLSSVFEIIISRENCTPDRHQCVVIVDTIPINIKKKTTNLLNIFKNSYLFINVKI